MRQCHHVRDAFRFKNKAFEGSAGAGVPIVFGFKTSGPVRDAAVEPRPVDCIFAFVDIPPSRAVLLVEAGGSSQEVPKGVFQHRFYPQVDGAEIAFLF